MSEEMKEILVFLFMFGVGAVVARIFTIIIIKILNSKTLSNSDKDWLCCGIMLLVCVGGCMFGGFISYLLN